VPTLDCRDFSVTVLPGTCVTIENPCSSSGEWARVDHFRLYEEPEGLFLKSKRTPTGAERQLCAADTVEQLVDHPVTYLYTVTRNGGRPDYGEGIVYITTVDLPGELEATASATPSTIAVGESTQLDVAVAGGMPPYTYLWTANPVGGIDIADAQLKSPAVSPSVTTEYTVAITDAAGGVTSATVDVPVGITVAATATPDTIDVGGQSQLAVTATGGAPPYAFSWVPVSSLDDWTLQNPVASPVVTTNYAVTVLDSEGATGSATVVLTVWMEAEATATPAAISEGEVTQLNASVRGGLPPYTYAWTPAALLDDPTAANPVAQPTASETYTVTVTDPLGQSASAKVQVTVNPGGPVASFTVTPNPATMGGAEEVWDASSSTGLGLEYQWEFTFPGAGEVKFPFDAANETLTFPIWDFLGTMTAKLIVRDQQGRTDESTQQVLVIEDPPPAASASAEAISGRDDVSPSSGSGPPLANGIANAIVTGNPLLGVASSAAAFVGNRAVHLSREALPTRR
jgi:hypothetical protein